MTSLVGIYCTNGVVIGADSSATFAKGTTPTIEQPTQKIQIIGNSVIVAGTGSIGLGQRFINIVKTAWAENKFSGTHFDIAKYLCKTTRQDFAETSVEKGKYGALVAIPASKKVHLCEFGVMDFQPEFKTDDMWFCSMGATQTITDSFLAFIREVFWSEGMPNIHGGIFAATWTLDHVIRINPGGVNRPVKLAVLERIKREYKARMISKSELGEYRQHIDEIQSDITDIAKKWLSVEQPMVRSVPEVPK
jgi:hypothetical protein